MANPNPMGQQNSKLQGQQQMPSGRDQQRDQKSDQGQAGGQRQFKPDQGNKPQSGQQGQGRQGQGTERTDH